PEPIDKFVVNVHAPQQAIIKGSGDTRDQFVQAADPQGGVFSGKVPIDVSKLGSAPIRFTIDNRLERGHSVEGWVRLIADENLPENPLAQMRLQVGDSSLDSEPVPAEDKNFKSQLARVTLNPGETELNLFLTPRPPARGKVTVQFNWQVPLADRG